MTNKKVLSAAAVALAFGGGLFLVKQELSEPVQVQQTKIEQEFSIEKATSAKGLYEGLKFYCRDLSDTLYDSFQTLNVYAERENQEDEPAWLTMADQQFDGLEETIRKLKIYLARSEAGGIKDEYVANQVDWLQITSIELRSDTKIRIIEKSGLIQGTGLNNQDFVSDLTKRTYSKDGFAGTLKQLIEYVWKTAKEY